MKTRTTRTLTFLTALALFLAFPASALADTVQGRVASANSGQLELIVFDANNQPYPNTLKMKVDNFTKLNGYTAYQMPGRQDMVRVSASQQKSGLWHADSISKLKGANLPPVSAPPSANMMDALKSPQGQTVIKRGLVGAGVGAIAAGSSGGKAGKGALVGAGASILGGFLMDALSQPRQQPQQQQTQQVVYTNDPQN